ncbi:SpaA isopeptide-forming pilin-related protein [Emergencia timonensis]|nr:SpaA isopeptide-forming pilin-related protein [Emergencia timonensis]
MTSEKLEYGSYYLVERSASYSYVLNDEPILFKLNRKTPQKITA